MYKLTSKDGEELQVNIMEKLINKALKLPHYTLNKATKIPH